MGGLFAPLTQIVIYCSSFLSFPSVSLRITLLVFAIFDELSAQLVPFQYIFFTGRFCFAAVGVLCIEYEDVT